MTRAGREVSERHLKGAADFRLQVVHFAGESVRRKPFGPGIRIQECPVDLLGRGTDDTMKSDGVRGHDEYSFHSVGPANADCGLRNESNRSRESELRVTLDDLRRFAVALSLCVVDALTS